MSEIKLREDYIKLGQALKAAGSVGSGVDAKFVIQDGRVKVNGETEYQRGKKLYDGDVITYEGETSECQSCCVWCRRCRRIYGGGSCQKRCGHS